MKRRHLLLGLMLVFSLGVITTPAYAASDCKEIDFGAEELCIEIDKDGDDYELDTEVTGAGSSYALKCDILLPNNELHNVGACDGEFEYDDDDKGKVKIYARLDGEYKVLEATYDFDDGEWVDDDDDDDDDDNDEEGFDVDVDDDEPDEGERIDLEIEAIDDDGDRRTNYDEDIRIIVEMYDNGDWDEVDDDDEFDFHGIDETEEFDEDDDGLLEFSNAISFNEEKKFRICVEEEDDDDVRGCVTIEVGDVEDDDEGDADDIDEVEVDVDDTSIKTNERIDLIIELLDDDGDRVEDITEEITITVEDDGDEVDEGDEYDLIGIDNEEDWDDLDTDGNGYVKLNNVIEFNEEGEFTIIVEINGEKGEIDIEVDNNSNSDSDDIDDIKVDVDDDTPKTNQEIDLIIELLDDDNDRVEDIDAEIKITVEDEDGDEVDEGDEYDLIGIDDGDDRDDWDTDGNGYYRGRDVIEFNDEGEFTIIIEIDGEKGEVTVDVDDDNTSDNDDIDNFRITANPSRPDEDEDIDITVIARDNDNDTIESYEGEVEFIVQKRVSGFRRTAGSADYDIDDDEYEFDEDDDGEKKFNNFLEFKDEGEFRLKVVDTDVLHAYGYVYFDIGDDDSDVDGFSEEELETVEAIYKIWSSLIDELKDDYSDLEDNDEREDLSDDLYDDMEEIIDDENNRTIDDYDEFIDRFSERYSFTISERD